MLDENDIKTTLAKINRNDLYITYDTSHFYTCDGNVENLWEYFDKLIKNVHLVDNFSKDSDTHPPLGTGKVNFHEIFDVMDNHNYQGPIIIELSTTKDLTQSINFINKFL
jgi:sugar phosphate isomerase/epimerase